MQFKIDKNTVESAFKLKFNQQPSLIVQSPARINLMGEHTDYNGGLVFPAAIDKYIYFAISKSSTTEIVSLNQSQNLKIDLENLSFVNHTWQNYFLGVIDILKSKHQLKLQNFSLVFGGNIPLGAGLSSSAALTCGFIFSLNNLFELNLDKWQIAKIAQQCEHDYIGLQCGIMDQFAVLFGSKNAALILDCTTLSFETVNFDLGKYSFLLCNSKVSHNLANSAYNERFNQCQQALSIINQSGNNFNNLSEIQEQHLNLLKENKTVFNRALHVFFENERVKLLKNALLKNDLLEAGNLLNQSHESLRDLYEVTCPETDYLFEYLNSFVEVLGSRQMGGGFGGCMLILVKTSKIENLKKEVSTNYKNQFNLDAEFYEINISDGCF